MILYRSTHVVNMRRSLEIENGYEVLILWEDELNLNFEECKNKIKNFLEK